jgi:gamma-glutamylcyclotransferase (GGCT)/AIG2-like uncharacterized protein YtfP
MTAKIYQPSKTAMQSGKSNTHAWVLQQDEDKPRAIDALSGFTSSTDMTAQVKLNFASKEEAIAYCVRKGIAYSVQEPQVMKRRALAYTDNFKYNRVGMWTH